MNVEIPLEVKNELKIVSDMIFRLKNPDLRRVDFAYMLYMASQFDCKLLDDWVEKYAIDTSQELDKVETTSVYLILTNYRENLLEVVTNSFNSSRDAYISQY